MRRTFFWKECIDTVPLLSSLVGPVYRSTEGRGGEERERGRERERERERERKMDSYYIKLHHHIGDIHTHFVDIVYTNQYLFVV